MIKNILAVIGAVTVGVNVVRGYNRYIKAPLEEALTNALDKEVHRVADKRFRDATAGDAAGATAAAE